MRGAPRSRPYHESVADADPGDVKVGEVAQDLVERGHGERGDAERSGAVVLLGVTTNLLRNTDKGVVHQRCIFSSCVSRIARYFWRQRMQLKPDAETYCVNYKQQ